MNKIIDLLKHIIVIFHQLGDQRGPCNLIDETKIDGVRDL
jgi:hypothetical protein